MKFEVEEKHKGEIRFFWLEKTEIMKISKDGFWWRGQKMEPEDIGKIYERFKEWFAKADFKTDEVDEIGARND